MLWATNTVVSMMVLIAVASSQESDNRLEYEDDAISNGKRYQDFKSKSTNKLSATDRTVSTVIDQSLNGRSTDGGAYVMESPSIIRAVDDVILPSANVSDQTDIRAIDRDTMLLNQNDNRTLSDWVESSDSGVRKTDVYSSLNIHLIVVSSFVAFFVSLD